MSLFQIIQRCSKTACVVQKTLNSWSFKIYKDKNSCNNIKRSYCIDAPPNLIFPSEHLLNDDLRESDDVTQELEVVQDENEFGKLQRSLESIRKEKKKVTETVRKPKQFNTRLPRTKSQNSDLKLPNKFGNLSDSNALWYPSLSEEVKDFTDPSDDSVIVIPVEKRFKTAYQYLTEMKQLVKGKKIKEALELFLDMKRNYVQPIHANYTFMIGACGRAGYTDMAFKLLRQMTDRGMRPTPATLTGAFNSCAECPFPEIGLQKANLLKEKVEQKNWLVTQRTYHAMIKAYGKCGDIQSAFQVVDQMAKEEIKIDVRTYSFLLMTCVADKEAGFTHAVEVWRKMKAKRIKPNVFTYNLLLRTVRDCGIGPEEVSCLLLQHWSSYSKRPYGLGISQISSEKDFLRLTGSEDCNFNNTEQESLEEHAFGNTGQESSTTDCDASFTEQGPIPFQMKDNVSGIEDRTAKSDASVSDSDIRVDHFVEKERSVTKIALIPSILAARPVSGFECLDLGKLTDPWDKLALIGTARGLLESMAKVDIKPDIKTFTLILESLPHNTESEEELLMLLDTYNVQPDVDFFNVLIKKRNVRKDVTAGKSTLLLINKYGLTPDIVTFGVLALGCLNRQQAIALQCDMQKIKVSPNIEIIGAFIHNATKTMDFGYMKDTLKLMIDEEIKPNEKVLLKLENAVQSARNNIIDMEHGKDVDRVFKSQNFKERYKSFCSYYEEWLKVTAVEMSEHPWAQFKTDITDKIKEEFVQ